MPMPTGSVEDIIRYLKKEKPDMPHKQRVAIAMSMKKGEKESVIDGVLRKMK